MEGVGGTGRFLYPSIHFAKVFRTLLFRGSFDQTRALSGRIRVAEGRQRCSDRASPSGRANYYHYYYYYHCYELVVLAITTTTTITITITITITTITITIIGTSGLAEKWRCDAHDVARRGVSADNVHNTHDVTSYRFMSTYHLLRKQVAINDRACQPCRALAAAMVGAAPRRRPRCPFP